MTNARKLATIVTGTASILLMQLSGSLQTSFTPTSGDLAISLRFSEPAVAAEAGLSYEPPDDIDAPQSTRGTGSRGCNQSMPVSLTLLVPADHTGLTASGHPSFYWYLAQAPSAPLEFALVEPGIPQPIFTKQIQSPSAGIMGIEMPKELPELAAGKKYRWSVTVVCNANRPSSNVFAQSWIKRVSPTQTMVGSLTAAKGDRDRASLYAKGGLWFDALATISKAFATDPNNQSVVAERLSLLDQVGLSDVAKQERNRVAMH